MGPEPRVGDHRWWISDLTQFEADYPDWSLRFGIDDILTQIYEHNADRWEAAVV
jgi:CDP-paratose 2-epimerase